MCGLFDIFYDDATCVPPVDTLAQSVELMNHRGPDAANTWSAPGIGLGHARLSLVDPNPRSNQPFWDQNRRYVLVYNGEIYNFRELRDELTRDGVTFQTSSDTEVLLQCLIHFKPTEILPRLGGMFAFAFYDTQTGRLLLARDRFGMKPLFLYKGSNCLAFTSEVKALRPWDSLQLNEFPMASYLLGFGGPTKGVTFYENVDAIAPGSFVVAERGERLRHENFFTMPDFLDPATADRLAGLSPEGMVDTLNEADQDLKQRILHLDVWGRICLRDESTDSVRHDLKKHVSIQPAV